MNRLQSDLVLVRHGESTANAQGLFIGILDAPLTPRGLAEAATAGALLKGADLVPGLIYRSALTRAKQTVTEMLEKFAPCKPAVVTDWRLNERNYGALTGQSKSAVAAKYGVEQFLAWRRSFAIAPPPMSPKQRSRVARTEPFRSLPPSALTSTESLADVRLRILPFVESALYPALGVARSILVVGHGNSLRALCMVLEGLTPAYAERVTIPTGRPLRYRFVLRSGIPVMISRTYPDPDAAVTATALLNSQGGT